MVEAHVTDMANVSKDIFNQDIGDWTRLFYNWTFFIQSGYWRLEYFICLSMSGNVLGTTPFNHDIGDWNVSSVNYDGRHVLQMIFLIKTLAEIGIHQKFIYMPWDVPVAHHSIKTLVIGMFQCYRYESNIQVYAISFNQDISDWNVIIGNRHD